MSDDKDKSLAQIHWVTDTSSSDPNVQFQKEQYDAIYGRTSMQSHSRGPSVAGRKISIPGYVWLYIYLGLHAAFLLLWSYSSPLYAGIPILVLSLLALFGILRIQNYAPTVLVAAIATMASFELLLLALASTPYATQAYYDVTRPMKDQVRMGMLVVSYVGFPVLISFLPILRRWGGTLAKDPAWAVLSIGLVCVAFVLTARLVFGIGRFA